MIQALFTWSLTVIGCIALSLNTVSGQSLLPKDKASIQEGNQAYERGDYVASGDKYQEAISANAVNPQAHFNLGDALYQQQKFDEAGLQFQRSASLIKDTEGKAAAFHNLGNAMLKKQDVKAAVEAYKQSLRLNPKDEDTRYNLAYAQKLLQQQQQQQNQNQNQDNQDQQKDKEDQQQDQNQDQQNQQDQENQQQEGEDQENEQSDPQQQNPSEADRGQLLSEEEIERMLQALRYQEDKLQDKLQRQKIKAKKVDLEKDW